MADSELPSVRSEDVISSDDLSDKVTETTVEHDVDTSAANEDSALISPSAQGAALGEEKRSIPSAASPVPPEETTDRSKVDLLLKAVGDAPIMKKKRWAVEPTKKVAWVSEFVRKYLKCESNESLFLYVNQYFSPSPDQEIGSLYECFGSDGKLILHYCKQQAWG